MKGPDYFLRQGHEPDALMAELDTPHLRRRYVASLGPFVLPGVGHFVQWEAADTLNKALACFLR